MKWVMGARPRTLPASVVPVAIGAGAAAGDGDVAWWRVLLALVVSLALQVGVNYANDYSDGVRGTDADRVGPVRLTASGLAAPGAVRAAALLALAVAAVAGLVLAAVTTWWLVAIGAACLAAAWGYTGGPVPYGYRGLGDVAVFVFFGLVAVVGTAYVAADPPRVPEGAWPAGVSAGLLSVALLISNNLRDLDSDAAVGKRTLAVRLGDRRTRSLYRMCLVLPFAVPGGLAIGVGRPWLLLALLALPLMVPPARAVAAGARGPDLLPVLAATGRLQLAYGALLTLGLALS